MNGESNARKANAKTANAETANGTTANAKTANTETANGTTANRTTAVGKLRFWGSNWLQGMGLAAGVALILFLFWGFGAYYTLDNLLESTAVYSYYLIVAGGFCIFLMGVAYFQTYFSILVSMNATRKSVVRDIMINVALMILGVIALAAIIWKLIPGEVAEGGLELLPLLAGVLFISASICVVLGSVITRWGKIGTIVFAIICMLLGGCAGAAFAMMDSQIVDWLMQIDVRGFDLRIVTAAGVLLYAASGVFSALVTGKMEVRA